MTIIKYPNARIKVATPVYNKIKNFTDRNGIIFQEWCSAILNESVNKNIINYAEKMLLELDDCLFIEKVDNTESEIVRKELDVEKTIVQNNGLILISLLSENIDALVEYCHNNMDKIYQLSGFENYRQADRPMIKFIKYTAVDTIHYKYQKSYKHIMNKKINKAIFAIVNAHALNNINVIPLIEDSLSKSFIDKKYLCGVINPQVDWYDVKSKSYKPIWRTFTANLEKVTKADMEHALYKLKETILTNITLYSKKNNATHHLYTVDLAIENDLDTKIRQASEYLYKKIDMHPNKIVMNSNLFKEITSVKLPLREYLFEPINYNISGYDVILSDKVDNIILYRNCRDFISIYYSTFKCKLDDLNLYFDISDNFLDTFIQISIVNTSNIVEMNNKLNTCIEKYKEEWFIIDRNQVFYSLKKHIIKGQNVVRELIENILYNKAVETNTKSLGRIITNNKGLVKYTSDINFEFAEHQMIEDSFYLIGFIGKDAIYLDPLLNNNEPIYYTFSYIEILSNGQLVRNGYSDILLVADISSDIKILL